MGVRLPLGILRPFLEYEPLSFRRPLERRIVEGTAWQHGISLTGMLRPCGERLEANGVRKEVPRRMTSRAGRSMATVHIDLDDPYEASMGESLYLLILIDRASR